MQRLLCTATVLLAVHAFLTSASVLQHQTLTDVEPSIAIRGEGLTRILNTEGEDREETTHAILDHIDLERAGSDLLPILTSQIHSRSKRAKPRFRGLKFLGRRLRGRPGKAKRPQIGRDAGGLNSQNGPTIKDKIKGVLSRGGITLAGITVSAAVDTIVSHLAQEAINQLLYADFKATEQIVLEEMSNLGADIQQEPEAVLPDLYDETGPQYDPFAHVSVSRSGQSSAVALVAVPSLLLASVLIVMI